MLGVLIFLCPVLPLFLADLVIKLIFKKRTFYIWLSEGVVLAVLAWLGL